MQKLDDKTETGAPVRRVSRLRSRAAGRLAYVAAAVIGLVAGGMAPAMASTTTDPLNGGGDGIFTDLTSYLTGTLVGKVFALAIVSIAIGLVLRWVRKAVHA